MDMSNQLRSKLIRTIQRLSLEKLEILANQIKKIENKERVKEQTLLLAGSWKDLGEEFFQDLTKNLHQSRLNDRQIN